jgi:NADH:ubiquinone oxidoreductase subunit F (NADH-binding)
MVRELRPAEQHRHQAVRISGHVNTPCVVEEAMSIPLKS